MVVSDFKKFSFVIPLYNKAGTVGAVINSLINQTYPHFEVIIVDDGSTDNGVEIIKNLNDERIRIISELNNGVSTARNIGISLAKNEWICLLDADDRKTENFLEEMVKAIHLYPEKKIFSSGFYCVYENKTIEYDFPINSEIEVVDYLEYLVKGWSCLNSSSAVIHKDVFNLNIFNKTQVQFEDFDFFIRIYEPYSVVYINKPLMYRSFIAENRASEKQLSTQSLFAYFKSVADVFPRIIDMRGKMQHYMFKRAINVFLPLGSKMSKIEKLQFLQSAKCYLKPWQYSFFNIIVLTKLDFVYSYLSLLKKKYFKKH